MRLITLHARGTNGLHFQNPILLFASTRANSIPTRCLSIATPLFGQAKKAVDKDKRLKTFKPHTPGLRQRALTDRTNLWKGRPYAPLTIGRHRKVGRNNLGRITTRHRGGGHKRLYRTIDFKRRHQPYTLPGEEDLSSTTVDDWGSIVNIDKEAALGTAVGVIERIEYDPNRSARIALVNFQYPISSEQQERIISIAGQDFLAKTLKKKDMRYMLCTEGMTVGTKIMVGPAAIHKVGNTLPLRRIQPGTFISNIELHPGKGGQICRAAGTMAEMLRVEEGFALIRLPSKDIRKVPEDCLATVGQVSNQYHNQRNLGKAGAARWLGIRPTVRGTAMNPIDHPHGGGNGKDGGGTKGKRTPWGKLAKFVPTRVKKKAYNAKLIMSDFGDMKRKGLTKKTK